MATLALILFGATALGGVILATRVQRGELPPMGLALGHGVLAAAGIVTLILLVSGSGGNTLTTTALVLFVAAALGGGVLFRSHVRGGPISKGVMVVHAVVAVGAFALLLWSVL